MKILVVNAGSSSLKYQLIDMNDETLLAKGICEQIGDENSSYTHKVPADPSKNVSKPYKMADHSAAIELVLDLLVSEQNGVISSMDEIGAVGHRVLHGGEKFSSSVVVNDDVKEAIKECFKFGPLHNPANFKGIEACESVMNVPQVAVFDTGFHQSMPDYAYMYALPYEFYEKDGVRKYGFHGTSHRYVAGRAVELLGGKAEGTRIITCHLGNGSSISAVKDGKCYDTTMGLTPLEGIMMGTRCGSIDPAIVTTIMKDHNLTPEQMDSLMNKKSGMLGIAGVSDNREIASRAEAGDKKAILVQKMLVHQLTKYVGAFAAAMGGVDAIVFTGGIGENSGNYREAVAANIEFLGTKLDKQKNEIRGEEVEISTADSKVKMFVIPTNEELVIARDTLNLVK